MKPSVLLLYVAVLASMSGPSGVRAESPATLNYQGRLLDNSGAPVNGAVSIAVSIYTAPTAVDAVYAETVGSVLVQNGLYSFSYGTNSAALRTALEAPEAWLELWIDGAPLSPRQRLNSAPYALNVDERGLVQSTQFLLDMVARHEMEIEAIRAKIGLGETPPGTDYFLESFPDADGQHNAVNRTLTDAYHNLAGAFYSAMRVISEPAVSNVYYTGYLRRISNVNHRVSLVSDEFRTARTNMSGQINYEFFYSDGSYSSNQVQATALSTNWVTRQFVNPMPLKTVSVYRLSSSFGTNLSVRNTFIFLDGGESNAVSVALDLPAITNQLTHIAAYGTMVNRVPGDYCDFSVTDGSVTFSNLQLNTKTPLTGMTSNPTRVFFHLHAGITNTLDNTGLESIMFKWWTD